MRIEFLEFFGDLGIFFRDALVLFVLQRFGGGLKFGFVLFGDRKRVVPIGEKSSRRLRQNNILEMGRASTSTNCSR